MKKADCKLTLSLVVLFLTSSSFDQLRQREVFRHFGNPLYSQLAPSSLCSSRKDQYHSIWLSASQQERYLPEADVIQFLNLAIKQEIISGICFRAPHQEEISLLPLDEIKKINWEKKLKEKEYTLCLSYFPPGSNLSRTLKKEKGWVVIVKPRKNRFKAPWDAKGRISDAFFYSFLDRLKKGISEDQLDEYFDMLPKKKNFRTLSERTLNLIDLEKIPKTVDEELNQFVGSMKGDRAFHFQMKSSFIRWLLGKSTLEELISDIMELGFTKDESKILVRKYLMLDREEEVKDIRSQIQFEDRVKILEEMKPFLSEKGIGYLAQLKQAIAEANTSLLQLMKQDFPSVSKPHLEYFKPLKVNDNEIEEILSKIENIRIVQGCSHSCRHCFFSPSPKVQYMPFYRIVSLLEAAKRGKALSGRNRRRLSDIDIALYRDSEMMDYYDPLFDADCGDVVAKIREYFPEQEVGITTRGWYLGDHVGPRAARKMVDLGLQELASGAFRMSLDLYDIQSDPVRYICRAAHILDSFASKEVVELVVTSDYSNQEETKRAVELIKLLTLNKNVRYHMYVPSAFASGNGRGKKINTNGESDVGYCMIGDHLLPDGSIVKNNRCVREQGSYQSDLDWMKKVQDFEMRDRSMDSFQGPDTLRYFKKSGVSLWDSSERGMGILPKKIFTPYPPRKYLEDILIHKADPFSISSGAGQISAIENSCSFEISL